MGLYRKLCMGSSDKKVNIVFVAVDRVRRNGSSNTRLKYGNYTEICKHKHINVQTYAHINIQAFI